MGRGRTGFWYEQTGTENGCVNSDPGNTGGASCVNCTNNNFGGGVEAANGITISCDQGLCYDTEDWHLEPKKHSSILEASNHELSSSSSEKCHDGDAKVINSNLRNESDHTLAPPVATPPESDVEEEDVKVCDICGDAGREELLAVCCRCSDGAEHTYCMREMLDKVPDGDWLCEECKCNQSLEARKLDHSKKIGSHERNKSFGRTSSLLSDFSSKLDSNDTFCGLSKLRNVSLIRQASSKRSGEGIVSCPTAKKQALESSMGSPMMSSPCRVAVLSKDAPSKIKGKPTSPIPAGTEPTEDLIEIGHSSTTNSNVLRGNFLKSKSFSSSNSKQNVKVSEDIPQKQGIEAKEGIRKLMGKSMSFKGLGRSCLIEPKVKLIPAKCAPVQDFKGLKHGRDRTSYERKNIIKTDHSLFGNIAANPTKRPSAGHDGISTLSVTNNRDYKSAQTDGKSSDLLKHAGHLIQKTSDNMTNLGIVGSISVSGTTNSLETKHNNFSTKDGSMVSSPQSADGLLNTDGVRANLLDSQSEKSLEYFSGCSRQGFNNKMVSGSRRKFPLDASALKTKDGLLEENKLKAAIEAAMQKKQDIFKKIKIPGKATEIPISKTQGDPEEAVHEGDTDLHDIYLNSSQQMSISGTKQTKFYSADSGTSPIGESVLTVLAIPEQEPAWQGGFEIHRSGKLPDICCGFQAHMSMFASGEVLEMVGKFPNKIIFHEVPRPCAWPVQFKALGAREDNIALYFFAKDVESYMRSYKSLVDYMMKHDLALRGNIDGVELLVFPSNHLPCRSKCWNTLYFFWGVFRGRRPRFLDDKLSCSRKCELSVFDTVVLDEDVASTEEPCLSMPATEQLSITKGDSNVVSGCEVPVTVGSPLQQCVSLSNGDCDKVECSVSSTCLNSPPVAGNHKRRSQNPYTGLGEAYTESRSAALREHWVQNPNWTVDLKNYEEENNRGKNLPSKVILRNEDGSLLSKLPLVGKLEGDTAGCSVKLQALDTEFDYLNQMKFDNSLKEENQCLVNMQKSSRLKNENHAGTKENTCYLLKNGAKVNSDGDLRSDRFVDINVSADSDAADDIHRLQHPPTRHADKDFVEANSVAVASVTCKKKPWVDGLDMSEDGEESSLRKSVKGCGDGLEVQMGCVSFSSHKEDSFDEAYNEKSIAPSAEGGLYPVDGSLPIAMGLSENVDCLPVEYPNLELALGVRRKKPREGISCFFAGDVDRNDPDRSSDVAALSQEGDGDASASLSLSLGFLFPDEKRMTRPESST